jgi:hypothetical protein
VSDPCELYGDKYGSAGLYLDVDTSGCGHTEVPTYITSIAGDSGHDLTRGATSVYAATTSGFRVYVKQAGITPAFAASKQWRIEWASQPDFPATGGASRTGGGSGFGGYP